MIRILNRSRARFSVGARKTKYNFNSFWNWSYFNVDTPLLRGVLIEYLVVSTLLDNAAHVVANRIGELTYDTATQKALRKSLHPFYSYQPHGDLFDLQLHWGVTIEVKSTEKLKGGKLEKTHWWGPINKRDNGEKLFPAQYYILAELVRPEGSENQRQKKKKHELPELRCYVCRGRDLEREAETAAADSIGYPKWAKLAGGHCSLFDLPEVLRNLSDHDTDLLRRDKLKPGWKMPRPSLNNNQVPHGNGRVYAPIAREDGATIVLSWWDITDENRELDPIPFPWREDVKTDFRDWEAAGFKFERAPQLDENGKRISIRRKNSPKVEANTEAARSLYSSASQRDRT